MNDPAFNLAQLAERPHWYNHLPQVEAAMADDYRTAYARHDAGWTADEGGWYSPDGMSESAWEDCDYPFPEDIPAYTEWFLAFYHYEAVNNDLDPGALNPYPNTPPARAHLYAL